MEQLLVLKENLIKKGYAASCFSTKEEAAAYLNVQIDGTTVGIGGSQTAVEMDIFDKLATHNTVYWHYRKPSGMTDQEARYAACGAKVYLTSVNGISEDGILVNIDGTGNRVAATFFGPEKVYLLVGSNKVAANFDAALFRARNVAAPLNARRLHRKTPCAVNADRCYDCSSPERICRGLSVFWCAPTGRDYEVILIDEPLGF